MKEFKELAYKSVDDFVYGVSPFPVKTKNGLVIGGGKIYPEINFTLPTMVINEITMPEVKKIYDEMINGVLKRAVELYAESLVVEIEFLPPLTMVPKWGIEVNNLVRNAMYEYEAKYGLKSALRITPNDSREMVRPPKMRSGEIYDNMFKSFEGCAEGGADFLSIESTGGKEINDDALLNADLRRVIFALGVMGVRDMHHLWAKLSQIAENYDAIPAGDSACGFGNTAMVLAEQGFIPRVFSSVVRVATVPRALAAYEAGALGPSKDCAYEGVYIKAITGMPISLEGKSAACAHLSPVGNIASCVPDLWSNESVQNVQLLSGIAPVVSIEQLIYDCRLMNTAAKDGKDSAIKLRNWLADSDAYLDPQAYVLKPDVVMDISREMLKEKTPYLRTIRAAELALDRIEKAYNKGDLKLSDREAGWLNILNSQLEDIPRDEEKLWSELKKELDLGKFIAEDYELTL